MKVSLLDYGGGNVRSVYNALVTLDCEIITITSADEIDKAELIIYPGVGSFGSAMENLKVKGFIAPLRSYLESGRPYLGICLGMQTLFESSEECPGVKGLGIIKGACSKFDFSKSSSPPSVPHIGWNEFVVCKGKGSCPVFDLVDQQDLVYFVHSYKIPVEQCPSKWLLTTTSYGGDEFVSSVQNGNVVATQFHPEKSGSGGLNIIKGFVESVEKGVLVSDSGSDSGSGVSGGGGEIGTGRKPKDMSKRVVVALDVRSNDQGDLIVTKGDQYDVREEVGAGANAEGETGRGGVRNLGKPVQLAKQYYEDGADEIAFLNITSFRSGVIDDLPMLQVLEQTSKNVFVPLTVGGGIKDYVDDSGKRHSALEVAGRYFRAGADKVSIGSDAVTASERFLANNSVGDGKSSIEQISNVYGVQAVVVSIDPKRVYLRSEERAEVVAGKKHAVVSLRAGRLGPNGEKYCWYQCTIKGGRESR